MNVCDESTGDVLGKITGILLHPERRTVEGFFVSVSEILRRREQFLAVADIARIGRRVTVRNREVLGPIADHIRAQAVAAQQRPIIGQTIITEGGKSLGICRDVQFATPSMVLEWLFPRAWLRWGQSIPRSAIIEVRPEAVVVRETEEARARITKQPVLPVPEAA